MPGLDFAFPADPNAGTQAAPFADLLLGTRQVVTQGMQPREADGKLFRYVGAAGVDKPRIVQVGIAGAGSSQGRRARVRWEQVRTGLRGTLLTFIMPAMG